MRNKYWYIFLLVVFCFMLKTKATHAQIPFELRSLHSNEIEYFKKGKLINVYMMYNIIAKNKMVMAIENDSVTLSDSSQIAIKDIYAIATTPKYYKTGQILYFLTGSTLVVTGYLTLKANHPYLFLTGATLLGVIPAFMYLYVALNNEGRYSPETRYYMSEYELNKTSNSDIFERVIR